MAKENPVLKGNQDSSIEDREISVSRYTAILNKRESELNEREKKLLEKEKSLSEGLPELDRKQALVASKIAQNEEALEKIKLADHALIKRRNELKIQEQENEKLIDELKEKILFFKSRELTLDEKEKEIMSLRDTLIEKEKQLNAKDDEVQEQQKIINRMNRDMNLQKRELEATQKKVQRLIQLEKLEKEVAGA